MIIKSINKTLGYKGLPDGFHVNFDRDVTYIVGDNFKTKSTILSVPLWVLTGYSMSGGNQEDVSNDRRNDIRNVIAEITIIDNDGDEHVISRSKGKNNIVLLDGVKTTKEYMAKFYKDIQFFLCAYNPYRFNSLKPVEQKELLLRLLPSISMNAAFKLLNKDEQEMIENPIIDNTEYAKQKRAEIKAFTFEIQRLEGVKDNCLETALMTEDEKIVFDKEEQLKDLKEQYEKLLMSSDSAINREDLKIKIKRLTEIVNEAIKVDLVEAKEEKEKLQEKLSDKALGNSICPTCKQEMQNEALKAALKRKYEKELKKLNTNMEEKKQETKKFLKELNEKKELLNQLNTKENIAIEERRNQIKEQIKQLEKEKQEIEFYNKQALNKKIAINKAKEQIKKCEQAIEELNQLIERYNSQIKISDKLKMLIIEEQVKQARDLLNDVDLKFSRLDEDTGELLEEYSITYKGRQYNKLSQSEKMRADFEISNFINKKSGINTAMFIDDTERIRDIEMNGETQIVIALYIKYSELSIFYEYNNVLESKKKSIERQLEEDEEFILLNAA